MRSFAHLLVKPLLRSADFADAGQQFVEVVPAARILEPLVVQQEALYNELPQMGGRPLAELGPARGADAVTDRQDEVEVVVGNGAFHLAAALGLNC